jgi:hypothetical protein
MRTTPFCHRPCEEQCITHAKTIQSVCKGPLSGACSRERTSHHIDTRRDRCNRQGRACSLQVQVRPDSLTCQGCHAGHCHGLSLKTLACRRLRRHHARPRSRLRWRCGVVAMQQMHKYASHMHFTNPRHAPCITCTSVRKSIVKESSEALRMGLARHLDLPVQSASVTARAARLAACKQLLFGSESCIAARHQCLRRYRVYSGQWTHTLGSLDRRSTRRACSVSVQYLTADSAR